MVRHLKATSVPRMECFGSLDLEQGCQPFRQTGHTER